MWTEIKNTKIISNYGAGSGGVHLFQNGENVLFENVLIADNQSQWGPGGIYSFSSEIYLLNSSIVNNATENPQKPGGLYASNYGNARMVNSLFYGNSPNDLGAFTE